MQIGDKVEYLGLCYRISAIRDGVATIQPFRKARNPRGRPSIRQIKVEDLKPWRAA